MASVAKYGFISAKIRGMKNKLLEPEDYNALLNRPYNELYKYLNSTAYAQYMRNLNEQSTPIEMEKAIVQNLFDAYQEILKWLPKNINIFIASYLTKFEGENIKAAIRCKYLELPLQRFKQYLVPVPLGLSTEEYIDAYIKTKNIKDLIQMLYLKGTPIKLSKLIENKKLKTDKNIVSWEIALDKTIYSEIAKRARKLRGSDRKTARESIGIEIDLCNIKNIIRGKLLNLTWEEMVENLIEETFKISMRNLRKTFQTKEIKEALKIMLFKHYREIYNQALNLIERNKLINIETILNKHLYNYYKNLWKKPHPFNIGLIIAYIGLKWFEIKNIKSIIYGKSYGLPANEIQKTIIY